ncbi:MAG TPA: TIGR03088 family PEP-CTERM/XrtA system glycosyltransferase [Steroidobacteraceae bacterium]|nr:TIGR03088 family PEP-CTERM/XrtA system glycosyltransferase [Steroidobacteraceae bacterium]
MSRAEAPLIVHVIHRLDIGGLENGLVNLINTMPRERFRHHIVCLTAAGEFRRRIRDPEVEVSALNRRTGQDLGMHWRLWRLLRRLRPAIVHTRNLAALECQWIAALARVRGRVHGEHGWDVTDLHGSNRRYNALRRATRFVVDRYVTMSRDLTSWLEVTVGVAAERIDQIYSGVDCDRFHPRDAGRARLANPDFAREGDIIIGTVGRMEPVKNPLLLVEAFIRLAESEPALADRLRLILVGDGPLREPCARRLAEAGRASQAWLAGSRSDIDELLAALDIFVLPSLNEGISNTILEAMASALPVVATRVGGSPEIVRDEQTGLLCEPNDVQSMCDRLRRYVADDSLRREHGKAGRASAERDFSLARMTERYLSVYERVLSH